MKKPLPIVLLIVLLFFCHRPSHGQAPAWQTAIAIPGVINGGSGSGVTAMTTDASGNVYVAGGYFGTATLGNLTLTNSNSNGASFDAFVAKWLPASGTFAWAVRVGSISRINPPLGDNGNIIQTIVVSGSSVYIGGDFVEPTAIFGNITLANASGSSGIKDGFVAKLVDAGNSASFSWAQRVGGSGYDSVNGLAVNGSSLYVGGHFSGTANGLGTSTLTSAGSTDIFVAKLVDAGSSSTTSWVQRLGGTGAELAGKMAVNGSTVYLTGFFSNSTAFGNTTLTSAGGQDGFVTQLLDAGSTVGFGWTQRIGGTGDDDVTNLAISGNTIYLTGYVANTVALGTTTLVSAGGSDAFVAKLTDAGSTSAFSWARKMGGIQGDYGYNIATQGGKVYVSGFFGDTGNNGNTSSATFDNTTLQTLGGTDGFVSKLIDMGNTSSFVWTQQAGSNRLDEVYGLVLSNTSVYIGGFFNGPSMVLGTRTLTNPNTVGTASNGFFAALTDLALPARDPALQAGLRLYPNPAHGTAIVRVPASTGLPTATLTLTDALGRTVRTVQVAAAADYPLNLAGLTAGVYAVQVWAGAALAVQRLVVE